jgi:hypothetical protein
MELVLFGAFSALAWYYMIGIIVIGIWFLGAIFSESLEFSLLSLALFIGLGHISGWYDLTTIDLINTFYIVVVYLIIGVLWSFFKYKHEVKLIIEYIKIDNRKGINLKDEAKKEINYQLKKSRIYQWIMFFPASMLKFVFGDMVEYIIKRLGKVYDKIAEYVINSELKGE